MRPQHPFLHRSDRTCRRAGEDLRLRDLLAARFDHRLLLHIRRHRVLHGARAPLRRVRPFGSPLRAIRRFIIVVTRRLWQVLFVCGGHLVIRPHPPRALTRQVPVPRRRQLLQATCGDHGRRSAKGASVPDLLRCPTSKLPDVQFHSGAAVGPRGRLFGRVRRVRLTVHRQGRLSPSERERLAQAPLAPPIPARRHVTVQPTRGHGALS